MKKILSSPQPQRCPFLRQANLNPLLSHFQTASSSGDPHVHIVKQVDSADEGLYTCIAGNVLGQVRPICQNSEKSFPLSYQRNQRVWLLRGGPSSSGDSIGLPRGQRGDLDAVSLFSSVSPPRGRVRHPRLVVVFVVVAFPFAGGGGIDKLAASQGQPSCGICDPSCHQGQTSSPFQN